MVWWCSTPHCSGHQVWRSCSSHVDPTCNEYPFPAETPLRFCTPSSAQAAEWCWLMMQMWRTVRVTIKSFREGGSISGMLLVCWVKVRGFLAVHRLVDATAGGPQVWRCTRWEDQRRENGNSQTAVWLAMADCYAESEGWVHCCAISMHANYQHVCEPQRGCLCRFVWIFSSVLFLIFRQLRTTFDGASMCFQHVQMLGTTPAVLSIRFRNGQLDVLCGSKMVIEGPKKTGARSIVWCVQNMGLLLLFNNDSIIINWI